MTRHKELLGYTNVPAATADFVRRLFAQDTLMYVAFGDSHTHGARTQGFLDGTPKATWKSFSNLMRDYLRSINPGTGYVNSGIGGNNSTQMLNRIQTDVLDHNPDIVIWGTGINDGNDTMAFSTFESNCTSIIQQIQAAGATLVVFNESPIVLDSRRWGYSGTDFNDDSEDPIPYYQRLRYIAREEGAHWIETRDVFATMFTGGGVDGDQFFNDRSHPHNAGHRWYFELLRQGMFGIRQR